MSTAPTISTGWITIQEFADRAGISRPAVYGHIKAGNLTAQMLLGRRFLSLSSLEKFLARKPRRPGPKPQTP